jgi:hypothetical protein
MFHISSSKIADKVESKYHFAGGCAGYMFSYPTVDILENIKETISTLLVKLVSNQCQQLISCCVLSGPKRE